MFTDVVGYTSMSSRDEGVALALLGRYRALMQSVFPRYEGRVVKTMGDGFLVEFASAVEAVNCAVEAQREMSKLNSALGEEEKIPVRIGIHVGDVVHSGEDVLGDAVNVASRVEPLAEPGGICITRQVVDQVEGKVQWQMSSTGVRHLRNFPNPVEVFSVRAEEDVRAERKSVDHHRVAILPFANLSPDPNDRYFADGMTEELISTVSRIGELSVISRSSAMKYRDTSLSMAQVGQELDVGAILEGSVRKAGNRVRISAQLIEVDADKYVWSQSFDRDITDVFGVQGEIAQRVAEALKVQLLSKEKERLEAGTTRSPEAYTLYLKGRFFWNERTEEGVKRAVKYFEEALAADAGFAKAYSGLADCYLILADYGWMAPAKAGELAKDNAMKALALDGSLAEAHASLGLVHVNHDWDFLQGEKEFKRAIELNPNYVSAYHWYSVLLVFLRRYEDSHRMIMRAKALDPYSLVIGQSRAVALIGLGRYDEAVDQLNRVLEESPDLVSAHYWLATTKLVQGKYPEAVEEAKREVAGDKYDRGAKLDLAFAHSEAGNKEEGSRLLEEVLSEKEAYYSPTTVGVVLLSLGREKEASEWMDRAFEERDSALLYFRSLPVYRGYLAFPGWSEIERKIGYPVETSPTS
jgi:class 3 adenylate cyclase/tetratricopeptide (TPR) repeat protein